MSHLSKRRVEFSDTDMAGIAHFSRFFLWMEQAEHDFLEARGLSVVFEVDGCRHGFPRVSASCDYQRPVRYRDWLDIVVTLESVGRSSLQYRFDFTVDGEPTAVVATGKMSTCLCKLGLDGMRSTPLSDRMREQLQADPGKAV
ncbi:MAG: acyl-CoA thioesterase [Planctomycetota bacterium]|jgi:acyl-CoA thioester hydrolase|nr:MAG: acyl-CoA thioesterase [Planctomycetota bacterium]RLS84324.1 MAG: acyl-CoA thioesterase [Planctomycetota bacterium]